jgi:soluble lytic murein transglycosylase-like protein
LSVGFVTLPQAQAQAPFVTKAQQIRALPPKAFAYYKVSQQWKQAKREFGCLHELWQRESHWNPLSHNKSSGAFGIAQFLPSTWGNYKYPFKPKDPQIQITAGLRYITVRYGSPCKAWSFWLNKAKKGSGWY